jgi:YHS domain-containing protein
MLKLLLLVGGIFVLFKLFTGDKKVKQAKGKKEEERLVASGEMVKDPICGAFVEKDGPIRVRSGETVHSFCSYQCRDKFLKQLEAGNKDQETAG